MARAKDPITAAITTYWKPLMREHGFRDYSIPTANVPGLRRRRNRAFGRVSDGCVLQFFVIHASVSAFSGEMGFHVRYASSLITRLKDSDSSTTTRWLESEGEIDTDWNAGTHDRADASMREARDRAAAEAIPWLDVTSTAAGLAGELSSQLGKGNPHAFFELGCCHATAADPNAALDPLREAIARFQSPDAQRAFGAAAAREREQAEELAEAITRGGHDELLARWREQTVANLRLSQVLD